MNDQQETPPKSFNSSPMLDNVQHVKNIVHRIRQKEGGVGSEQDELSLHRMVQDLNLLLDTISRLQTKFDAVASTALSLQEQNKVLKGMLEERDTLIKTLTKTDG